MEFKTKLVSLAGAAVMLLGVATPAFAAGSDQQDVHFHVLANGQFSVKITHGTNFGSTHFSLNAQDSSNISSASYDYRVIDMRGTGDGWSVSASSSDLTNDTTHATVPSTTFVSSNNTDSASFLPSGLGGEGAGFAWATGSITTGVSTSSVGTSIEGPASARVLMQSAQGISGVTPNGTGTFYDEEALFLTIPAAVEVGSYTATVTVNLVSATP